MYTIDSIPASTLEWFRFGNIYTGSVGDFRYRLCPDKSAGNLTASVYTRFSYHIATDVEEREFPLTEQGITSAREWVLSKLNSK